MKKCSKCLVEKELVDFYSQKGTSDGKKSWCKDCVKKARREYYSDNREASLLYSKRYTEENPDVRQRWKSDNMGKLAVDARQYREDNPEKIKAHSILNRAVKSGKVIRPNYCEDCFGDGKIEGHHEDYSKPLEVRWLCKRCHVSINKKEVSLGTG